MNCDRFVGGTIIKKGSTSTNLETMTFDSPRNKKLSYTLKSFKPYKQSHATDAGRVMTNPINPQNNKTSRSDTEKNLNAEGNSISNGVSMVKNVK